MMVSMISSQPYAFTECRFSIISEVSARRLLVSRILCALISKDKKNTFRVEGGKLLLFLVIWLGTEIEHWKYRLDCKYKKHAVWTEQGWKDADAALPSYVYISQKHKANQKSWLERKIWATCSNSSKSPTSIRLVWNVGFGWSDIMKQ